MRSSVEGISLWRPGGGEQFRRWTDEGEQHIQTTLSRIPRSPESLDFSNPSTSLRFLKTKWTQNADGEGWITQTMRKREARMSNPSENVQRWNWTTRRISMKSRSVTHLDKDDNRQPTCHRRYEVNLKWKEDIWRDSSRLDSWFTVRQMAVIRINRISHGLSQNFDLKEFSQDSFLMLSALFIFFRSVENMLFAFDFFFKIVENTSTES